jgi:hypothetical protein
MTAYNANQLGMTGSTQFGDGRNLYKYDDNVTVGGVSRKSGPAAGKKFPGKTIWYNN